MGPLAPKRDGICNENPSIQPPYVVDGSKKGGESDLSDEETISFEGSGEKFPLPWQKGTIKSRRFK